MTCHHQGILPFDHPCKQQHANDERFGLVSDKADGQTAITWTAALLPSLSWNPYFLGKRSSGEQCTNMHTSSSTATLHSSLPAGNSIRFVACGQLDLLSVDSMSKKSHAATDHTATVHTVKYQTRWNSKMAPSLAAIPPRAVWPPDPAKLAPSFAATDILKVLSVVLTVGGLVGDTVYGQQQVRPRQRIALNGFISHCTTGIPRWAMNEAALSGEPGDLIILRTTAHPGERIEAGVYLFFKMLDNNDKPTGHWTGVPASQRGIDWQYRSRAVGSVCSVVRFVNPGQKESDFDLPLFLPYAAMALPSGRYQFTYLVQVRANKALVDEFWMDHVVIGTVGSSGLVRPGVSCCVCVATGGPCLTPFRLQGTADTITPSPQPEPAPEFRRSK